MVTYVVTGANRGLGLSLVQALHARLTKQEHNPQDSIFAIVQDPDSCDELQKLAGPNFHIIPGDLDKLDTLHVRTACRLQVESVLSKVPVRCSSGCQDYRRIAGRFHQ